MILPSELAEGLRIASHRRPAQPQGLVIVFELHGLHRRLTISKVLATVEWLTS